MEELISSDEFDSLVRASALYEWEENGKYYIGLDYKGRPIDVTKDIKKYKRKLVNFILNELGGKL